MKISYASLRLQEIIIGPNSALDLKTLRPKIKKNLQTIQAFFFGKQDIFSIKYFFLKGK